MFLAYATLQPLENRIGVENLAIDLFPGAVLSAELFADGTMAPQESVT